MDSTPKNLTVRDLITLKASGMLVANPEYQRGAVWSTDQKKRLVDSLFRNYPLPLIYLHHVHTSVAGLTRDGLDVIDGQQRINAIYGFSEGAFKLFDPKIDAADARFPSFIQDAPCEWGGKAFDSLSKELQQKFLDTPLSVVYVNTSIPNEARDLFIRLQAGMPLNAQEKRDAWPGKFTEFVLKTGGKPELDRYPGNDFFNVAMKSKGNNRGEVRQLTAQMMMLFVSKRHSGNFCDTKRDLIDEFYYQNLDFDLSSEDAKRFENILNILTEALRDNKRKKIQGHEAKSLVLLVDSLLDDYTQSWRGNLAPAFDHFRHQLALGSKTKWDAAPDEYWNKYGVLARTNSDLAETIERRHSFFMSKMLPILKPVLKDPTRIFGEVEREVIYYRDNKRCQLPGCNEEVVWNDGEIHHIVTHGSGGLTVVDNGALVHKRCHPKGQEAVKNFAIVWRQKTQPATQATNN